MSSQQVVIHAESNIHDHFFIFLHIDVQFYIPSCETFYVKIWHAFLWYCLVACIRLQVLSSKMMQSFFPISFLPVRSSIKVSFSNSVFKKVVSTIFVKTKLNHNLKLFLHCFQSWWLHSPNWFILLNSWYIAPMININILSLYYDFHDLFVNVNIIFCRVNITSIFKKNWLWQKNQYYSYYSIVMASVLNLTLQDFHHQPIDP